MTPAGNGDEAGERPMVMHVRVVSGAGGGPEKTIFNSPRYLPALGYQAICAYMRPPGDPGFAHLEARAHAAGARLVAVDDRGPWDRRVPRRLLELCREYRVAIWHGHDYKSNALGLWLRRRWPMRLVTTVHGWVKFTRRTPLYYAVDRFCLSRYERVICVSSDLVEQCRAAGTPVDRIRLIHNAIDADQFRRRQSRDDVRRQLGLPADRVIIGAVGRLSAEKGFDVLIAAVERLLTAGRNVSLVILGDGDAEADLTRQIERLGRGDRIRLAGFQADLAPWYEAIDVFALSSLREGLPNVVLEAMAYGLPVVATRVAGVPDLVQSEESGLLVPPADEPALAAALERLVADANLRQTQGAAGRRLVEERFTFAERMKKVAGLYDELAVSG